jgi:hypothetical protein
MIDRSRRSPPTPGALHDFDRAFDRAFAMAAFALNRHLIDHMLRIGRELMLDDYEAMLIWGVLAHQNVAHLLPPGALPSVVLDDRGRIDGAPEGRRPLRLRDLVQITRLPRETVRRKLEKLAAQQWVEKTPGGWLSSRARLEPTLREFTRESVRRFLATAEELGRILRDAEDGLAAPSRPAQGDAAGVGTPARPSAAARGRPGPPTRR